LQELEERYAALPAPERSCVVHGDAWQGNIAVFEQQAVLLDLDHVSIGRPEWDLISLAVDRTDFERITAQEYREFVDAYGGFDVTVWPGFRTLADIQELRWAAFALAKAGSDLTARTEAQHRLTCLRGDVARPWTWSAF
jgi:aminoglycoside phosphotransferase (APT) family kinase protein